jgi:uncharacterized damage-inducible protein DinB
MDIANTFINEIKHESAGTRKLLERVPMDKLTWKPHDKSSTLMSLARHVANLNSFVTRTLSSDEWDVTAPAPPPQEIRTNDDLVSLLDTRVKEAIAALEGAKPEAFAQMWTMRAGDKVYFTIPKSAVIRNLALNHAVHHRGQLTVYLRMLNVPLPGLYGPTADEQR